MLRRTTFFLTNSTSAAATFAAVGSSLCNFTCLRKEDRISDLADPEGEKMEGSLWEHKETGTRVMFFNAKPRQLESNNNNNNNNSSEKTATSSGSGEKACSICFCTPAENDSGATHILEHTVLCGSEKFPTVRDPFFKMLRRSLSTFMNAMTYPDMTIYPFSTVNERDFFNILDVYLDCTLHPLIRPLDFAQEAHRLKVTSSTSSNQQQQSSENEKQQEKEEEKLQRTGVVLNEMKGALSDPTTFFHTELASHFYKGTSYEKCFGGDPAAIPKLQHSDLVSYYGRHYQKPIIAVFDSSIGNSESKSAFLEKLLKKILTEVTKPRKVIDENNNNVQEKSSQQQQQTPLEYLQSLRSVSDTTNNLNKKKFHFAWGPPEPIAQQQPQQQEENTNNNTLPTTTARISVQFPLESLIQSKLLATRQDHRTMFELQLLLHIIFRPPSGQLYRELLHNSANTKALSSTDVNVVKKRIEQILQQEENKNEKETEKEGQEEEEEDSATNGESGSSTLDLLPGSGLDHSAQVPAFIVGLQNVPVFNKFENESKNNDLCERKCELISLIVSNKLKDIAALGLDTDLVESSLHEYELALRTRDSTFAVRATISSVSAFIRGLDPFYSHATTDIDNEVASELVKDISESKQKAKQQQQEKNENEKEKEVKTTTTTTKFFSPFIEQYLLSGGFSSTQTSFTAVAGNEEFVQKQNIESEKEITQLQSQLTSERIKEIKKLDAELLEAQKKVDKSGEEENCPLPTLDIGDISSEPTNFMTPNGVSSEISALSVSTSSLNQNKNENKAERNELVQNQVGCVQTFVTNTAGLVYVRMLLPIPTTTSNNNNTNDDENLKILLPLFCQFYDQLGLLDCSIAEQDIKVRKVCSGFGAGFTSLSVPASEEDVQNGNQPTVRALSIGFHCLPQNISKSVDLLKQTFAANCEGLWSRLIQADPERRAMLVQLFTMYATDLESRVTHSGTQFATAEALLHSVESSTASTQNNNNSSALKEYAIWNGLTMVQKLSEMKSILTELVATGKDPLDALSPLFPFFESFSRQIFLNNNENKSSATIWATCEPEHEESVKNILKNELLSHFNNNNNNNNNSSSSTSFTIENDPLVVKEQNLFNRFSEISEKKNQLVKKLPLPGCASAFVGCVLPTKLHFNHPHSAAFRLALQIASQEFLHREIREIGGAYGSGARLGIGSVSTAVAGIASFGSYRDPSPDRTLDIIRGGGIYRWFKESPPSERMLREAKLSMFGGIDAPMTPQEVGDRFMVARFDRKMFSENRKRLLSASVDDVMESVEEHLKPEDTERNMSVCFLGKVD